MKICTNCQSIVPNDSIFCPYCGGKAINEIEPLMDATNFTSKKICNSCGNEVDADSIFCSFCGGKNLNDIKNPTKVTMVGEPSSSTTSSGSKNPYKIAFILTLILSIGFGYLSYYNYRIAQEWTVVAENLKAELKTANNKVYDYSLRAGKYSSLVTNLKKITEYSDLYANKYILFSPSNEKVRITFKRYNTSIWCHTSSTAVSAEWSKSWDNSTTSLYVTYHGRGIEWVKVYPDKNESHAIYIVCIGN